MPSDTPEPRDRLILVAPPLGGLLRGSPNGLIDLANYASDHLPELDVKLLDLSEISLAHLDSATRPLTETAGHCWVGITATTASYRNALEVARSFKRVRPDTRVILGGPHASADGPLVIERHDRIDFAVQGEGERSLVALIRHYPDVSRVPGVVYRVGDHVRANPAAPRLTQPELDRLPVTFKGQGLDRSPGKFGTVTYVSARGCPLQCAFCSVAEQAMTHKSVNQVIKDLMQVSSRFDYLRVAIEDNFFAHNLRRTVELCERLAELRADGRLPIRWDCQTRVESLKRRTSIRDERGNEAELPIIRLMEQAGCEAVYVGVESFVPEHLKYLRKTFRPDAYLQDLQDVVVPQLLLSGIECYINLQFGLPGERRTHHEHTLDVLRRLGEMATRAGKTITVYPQLHVVYPGTAHFAEGVEQGRFPRDVFEEFTEWEVTQQPVLRWLGEHFAHGTGGLPEGILDADPLRNSQFRIRPDRVESVDRMLRRMAEVEGIKVFQYGGHLVEEQPTEPCQAVHRRTAHEG